MRTIALSRTLVTEGVVVQLPAALTLGDSFAVPSLMAALQLGLREHLGGAPDHLAVERIVDPHLGEDANQEALLVHDVVPGGTGYLAELADPQKLWSVLRRAWTVVRDCPCQGENRAACHRCLSPWINGPAGRLVSRSPRSGTCATSCSAAARWRPARGRRLDRGRTPTAAYDPETHIEQKLAASCASASPRGSARPWQSTPALRATGGRSPTPGGPGRSSRSCSSAP